MDDVLALAFLLTIAALAVGLVRPQWVKMASRKRATWVFGTGALLIAFLGATFSDVEPKAPEVQTAQTTEQSLIRALVGEGAASSTVVRGSMDARSVFSIDAPQVHRTNGEVEGHVILQADVELDAFSGRQNPTWRLSETEAGTLNKMLSELPLQDSAQLPDNLGYRGFHIHIFDPSTGDAVDVTVYGEVVWYHTKDNLTHRVDKGRRLEMWLMKTSQSHIEPDLYERMSSELPEYF